MAITPKIQNGISAPNSLAGESVGAVAVPNSLTSETAGTVAAPIAKTAKAAGSVSVPNSLTSETLGTVAVPNSLTSETAGAVAVPATITPVTAAAFPRTLIPTLNLDFKNGFFSQNGTAKAQSDLLTYNRNSDATFLDRFLDSNGDWNYFLNTSHVGITTNLLTYSEQFDNAAWTKSNSTITANNTKAPDNSTSADKFAASSTATTEPSLRQAITSVAATSYTISAYLKRGEVSFTQVFFVTGHVANNPRINFDLSSGVIGSKDADIDSASIIPVGNDWFRVSVTVVAVGATLTADIITIKTAADSRSLANYWEEGEGLYIWGAQITQSSIIEPYVKSVSSSGSENIAVSLRTEYDAATGESLGALIEASSTNLLLRSEEFDNVVWSQSLISITANAAEAPDNSLTADKFSSNTTGTTEPKTFQGVTSSIGSKYTVTVFAKRVEAEFLQITFSNNNVANDPRVNFDLSSGVLGSKDIDIYSASIIPVGNDWFRLSCTVVSAVSAPNVFFTLIKSATDTRNQANAWTSGDGLYIWGAQIEAQGAPTSYIRTEGAIASRLPDLLSAPTAGNVPNGDVTFYADVDNNGSLGAFLFAVGSIENISLSIGGGLGLNAFYGTTGAVLSILSVGAKSLNATMVYSRKSNNIDGFINGAATVSADAGVPAYPNSAGSIGIGNTDTLTGGQLNGHIKRLTIYDKALTAQEVSLL